MMIESVEISEKENSNLLANHTKMGVQVLEPPFFIHLKINHLKNISKKLLKKFGSNTKLCIGL
ncbi:MAG: hypothetical protein RLY16_1517 [Bacteroidota bacterium]